MSYSFYINAELPFRSSHRDTSTARQKRILRYGPSLYLTPEAEFKSSDGTGKLRAWSDAIGSASFSPVSAPVAIVEEGDGLSSLSFTGTNGQALREAADLELDRLPPSGTPATVALLVRQGAGAGQFGGGLFGSPTPYGSDMLAAFVDRTYANLSLQTRFGVGGQDMFANALTNTASWHLGIFTWKGSAPGGEIIQNGLRVGVFDNIYHLPVHPNARKIQIGNYGPVGTDALIGRIAALAVFPVYVGGGENVEFLTDLEAEWGAWRTSLNNA
jgi:hypothetical protein